MLNWWLVTEKELQKLYKNFNKIDKDKSGTLEPEEFFEIPGRFLQNINLVIRVGVKPSSQKSDCSAWQE